MKVLITEARELCERATEGPWTGKENIGVTTATGEDVFETGCGCCTSAHLSADDASFISRSRTLIPELCDALEKAEAETRALSDCNRKMKEQNRRLIWRNWIPVTERLPEKYQSVLAARQEYAPNKQHYVCEAWLNDFNWQNSYGTMENVTHWMPLPAPPEKMEDKP